MTPAAPAVSPMGLIGDAIRRPEELVRSWRDRHAPGSAAPPANVFVVLGITGILSLAAYGFTMGIPSGMSSVGRHALLVPAGAAVSWAICLPSLYILYAVAGAAVDWSTAVLAALTAFCFGSVARLASAPVSWFFGIALPFPPILTALHVIVFGITALAMLHTFVRIMKTLAPTTSAAIPFLWLCCVGLIDLELKALFSVFAL